MPTREDILYEIMALSADHSARLIAFRDALGEDMETGMFRAWRALNVRFTEKYNARMNHLWSQHAALLRDES